MDNLKKATITNIVWKLAERILAQVISLFVSIILARLLTPDEYSIVGIVAIFFSFANVIISGGLNTALIQKKDADAADYSSVLYLSVAVSGLIYALLFFLAPVIADIYHQDLLIPIIRVMSLSLPVYAIKSVYCAYISSTLQFKKFFWSTLGGTIASAFVGVYMAINGYGAWALVAQQMTNTIIDTIILILTTKLQLVFSFSFARLKFLFNYGWKVFISTLIGVAYNEAIPLFLGIKFTPADLSFYTKGKNFPALISTTTTSSLSAVLFPVLAKYQDDREKLLNYTRQFIRVTSYVVFPLMLGFFAVSDNFILLLLTEKWLPASYYIKVFCIVFMFEIIHVGNCETIKALGRSDIFLVMEIIKKACYFVIIALFIFLGQTPEALALSSICCTVVVATIVNSYPNRKLIGYSYRLQIADLLPNLLCAAVMCIAVSLIGRIPLATFPSLFLQIFSGVAIYILLSIITKNPSFKYVLATIKENLSKQKGE